VARAFREGFKGGGPERKKKRRKWDELLSGRKIPRMIKESKLSDKFPAKGGISVQKKKPRCRIVRRQKAYFKVVWKSARSGGGGGEDYKKLIYRKFRDSKGRSTKKELGGGGGRENNTSAGKAIYQREKPVGKFYR